MSVNGLSDADKQAWLARMKEEEGFRDALILETYITLKSLMALVEQVTAQFAGGAGAQVLKMMGVGNGGQKG